MGVQQFVSKPAGSLPMYRQIYLRYRESINEGRLKPGDRVPSIRALASELNLARGTVEAAYQILINEGYFVSRGSAGTIVSPLIKPARPAPQPLPISDLQAQLTHTGERPLPLQMGMPALDAFPSTLWIRLASQTLRHSGMDGLIYPDARGHRSLRDAVAGYLGVSRGIACSPDQVFIVAGYRASLDLICRSLLQTGDKCWIEDPGYFAASQFFAEAGAELVPVHVDAEGLHVGSAIKDAPDARFAIVTPTHQSPLCVHMSMPRRQALLGWANHHKSWIIEDDYDGEYRYQGRVLPALKSLDEGGRVLYCGTFSKVLMPALRLAYLVVPESLAARFAKVADTMHSHCPQLWQVTTARFIKEGHFGRHLKKMRELYSSRRGCLVDALRTVMGPRFSVDHQSGGMHLVMRCSQKMDDLAVATLAKQSGMSVQALSSWYSSSSTREGLLLGFTNVQNQAHALSLAGQLLEVLKRVDAFGERGHEIASGVQVAPQR